MAASTGDTISSTQSPCFDIGVVVAVFMGWYFFVLYSSATSTGLSFLIAFLAFVYCFCTQKHRLSATRHSPSANRSVGK